MTKVGECKISSANRIPWTLVLINKYSSAHEKLRLPCQMNPNEEIVDILSWSILKLWTIMKPVMSYVPSKCQNCSSLATTTTTTTTTTTITTTTTTTTTLQRGFLFAYDYDSYDPSRDFSIQRCIKSQTAVTRNALTGTSSRNTRALKKFWGVATLLSLLPPNTSCVWIIGFCWPFPHVLPRESI